MVTVVDDDDYEYLSRFRWSASKLNRFYVCSGNGTIMHRVILNAMKGTMIDHINGNPLDNRKENLRFCTAEQNAANKAPFARRRNLPTPRFKGVHKYGEKFKCAIYKYNKTAFIEFVDSLEQGARIYDAKAIELNGEFAYLNFPEGYEHILPDRLIERFRLEKRGIAKRPEDY